MKIGVIMIMHQTSQSRGRGLVADDVEGAGQAVLQLSENEGRRNQLGRNAWEFASGFSMEHLIGRLTSRLQAIQEQSQVEDRTARGRSHD
ncbi:MAG TPA: hypothetical protein VND40_02515 [Nitrososphaerales archaeon]|nr:hypothetical protein [Nitrososphaerales archaeon]